MIVVKSSGQNQILLFLFLVFVISYVVLNNIDEIQKYTNKFLNYEVSIEEPISVESNVSANISFGPYPLTPAVVNYNLEPIEKTSRKASYMNQVIENLNAINLMDAMNDDTALLSGIAHRNKLT